MSVQVKNLVKLFANQTAVDDISFEVNPGEIVGFLGPNGAGKSTTMKIITSYLPPTEGSVQVCNLDVMDKSSQIKRFIGYLPEHNPLYLDMYVHEYLGFVGRIHGLKGKKLRDRISRMILLCGLDQEQNKMISSLSKGYKQRVGLAQALLHDPEVLILDEPTTGLDPNQIIEIRNLIRDISQKKTVIFSTHIMQEVQALCTRAIIINKGKIVADDKIDKLKEMVAPAVTKIIVEFANPVDRAILMTIDGVDSVDVIEDRIFSLAVKAGEDLRPVISKFAVDNNLSLVGLKQEEGSMEQIFQQFTKD